jgi:autotransporter-associated beta strand protein
MKNSKLQKLQTTVATWLLLAAVALGVAFCPQSAAAGTAYTLSTLTSGGSWANPAIWTPNTSAAGPGNTSGVFNDIAILPLAAGPAWNISLNSSPTIAALALSYTNATINAGTPTTSTLTFRGPASAITNTSGQTLTINPPVNLDTAATTLTVSNNGTIYLVNPGANFFPNLAPGGLVVGGGTLRIGNVTNNIASTNFALMTGAGTLQFDLAGVSTNTFFTNPAATTIGGGGTGIRAITGVNSFSDVTGSNPQILTNNSTGYLDIQLDGTTPSAALTPTSFGGIGSVTGKNGAIYLEQIHGSNNLGTAGIITTNANSAMYLFGPDNNHLATTIVSGGNINLGTGQLEISEGLTLNVDTNMAGFKVNTMIISDGHGNSFYRGGPAVVNWNVTNSASFAIAGDLSLSEPLVNCTSYFNMVGGTLTNGGNINLCQQGHNYDINTAVWTVSGGTQGVANGKGIYMSIVSGAISGAKAYSFLTITNTGVLNVPAGTVFQAGNRSVATDVLDTRSEATISLGGGTLNLGTPIARQGVTTNGLATPAAAWVQFYFNGGTLQLTANLPQVFTGFGIANSTADGVYVMAGGAVINNGGFNVGISNNLLEAASSTGGGLSSLGSGTLTLSGANTYTGPTLVSAGKLVTTTTSSFYSSGFSLADGATNQVVVTSSGTTLTLNSLTLGTSSGATIEFNTAALGSPSAALVSAGSVTLNGTATVNIYGSALTTGTYQLMTYYSGETINSGSGFVLGSLPLGVNATLTDTGTELDLNISSANTSLTWNGNVGSVWDINNSGNANWLGQPASVSTNYIELNSAGLPVTFDDTATGVTTITLNTNVHPASVTINNNNLNYSITGAGSIAGPLALTKNGTGVFTLGVTNNFTGVTLNAGTLGLSGGNNRLPVTDAVTFAAAAGLDLGGNSQSLTNLVLSALTSGTATVTNGSLTVTLAGGLNLSPAGALTGVTIEDLSGLNTFTYNQSGQQFYFYGGVGQNSTLKLAATNNITASAINLANGGLTAATLSSAAILLGQSNVINTATITLGGYHNAAGSIAFNSGLNSPNLTLRGTAGGVTPVGSITVGNNNNGTFPPQVIDTSAGSIDAVVGNLYVVNNNSGGGSSTMSMSNGTFNVGAIYLNNIFGAPTANLTATFNQKAGTVLAGSLGFNNTLTNGVPTFNTAYNLGTSTATGLLSTKTINIIGGTVAATAASRATLNFTNGTIENYDPAFAQSGSTNAGGTVKTNLTISGLAGGGGIPTNTTLNIVLVGTGAHNFFAESGYSITESNTALISGSGSLTANGPGTVTLYGTNSYAGNTLVSAGRLALAGGGSISNSPLISVAGGATFDVSGLSSGLLTLGSSQTLSNSASATGRLAGNLNLGTGTNSVSFTAGTPAFIVTNGTFTLPATGNFIVTNTGSPLAVGSYKIIATNTAGFVAGTLTNVTVNGLAPNTSASLSISNSELYVVVRSTTTTPPVLNFIPTGGGSSLQFSWLGSYKLQSQTNTLGTGLSATGWGDYPGGGTSPATATVDPSKGCVFFRLAPLP